MVPNILQLKQREGWWWPEEDVHCNRAVLHEWEEKGEYALSLCKKKEVCIQAGGNVGIFPAKLAEHFDSVYTFEPDNDNLRCFEKNNIPDNVMMYWGGLGDESGQGEIASKDDKNCGATQIRKGTGFPMYTIDRLNLPVDLIWLDIEGYEYKALLGGMETIKKYKPVIIVENKGLMPEFPSSWEGSEEFVKWMETLGYTRVRRMMRDDFYIVSEVGG